MSISMKEWLEQGEKETSKKQKVIEKVSKIKMTSWKEYLESKGIKCYKCPGVYANEYIKFVGFRGYIKDNINIINIKGEVHEGEAYPPPVVPVSNYNRDNLIRLTGLNAQELGSRFYLGILKYEVEIATLIFMLRNMGYENIALLMARGMGKTWVFNWTDQSRLKYFGLNIMMLSETNARLKVGNWVYIWALRNKYLKDPEKYARKSTYQHFELLNGSRMDIYKYSVEDLVGEHDVLLSLDDINKKKWQAKPSENEKMKEHYQSNINYIIRSGLELTGTRKYEGDVISHIIENTADMIVIKQSPFIECPHDNINDDGTYDPCDICKDLCLLAPEIHSYAELMAKMYEDFESWYSEMMQNPHPQEGGMVDANDLDWVKTIPFFPNARVVGVGIDSTESELDSVDMCGIVSCCMHGTDFPEFTFLNADVRKMPFRDFVDKRDSKTYRGILETISLHVRYLEQHYPGKPIIIAIERKGGGLYVIREAMKDPVVWWWYKYIVGERDKAKKGYMEISVLGINHTKEKVARVRSELEYPIKHKQIHFHESLYGSTFITQLLGFPRAKHDDGPDAGGMIKDELFKLWVPNAEYKPLPLIQDERAKVMYRQQYLEAKEPWRADIRKAKQMYNVKRRIR